MEAQRREDMERKIQKVDQITKQIEIDFQTTKSQSEKVKENIVLIDNLTSAVKDEIAFFETQAKRNNTQKTKLMVTFKVTLENLISEFAFFRKEFNRKMDKVQEELNTSRVNKVNIETNFKNIISTYGEKLTFLVSEMEVLKLSLGEVKVPMTE